MDIGWFSLLKIQPFIYGKALVMYPRWLERFGNVPRRKRPSVAQWAKLSGNASLADRAGMSFSELLAWHMTRGTRPKGNPRQIGKAWEIKEIAGELKVTEHTVWNWIFGNKFPNNYNILDGVLFGSGVTYNVQYDEFREELRQRCKRRVKHREGDRRGPDDPGTIREPEVLSYAQLDDLPVESKWIFQNVQYGEGTQICSVNGDRLFWLPAETRLLDADGNRRDPTNYFLNDTDTFENITHDKEVFFPRELYISGPKRYRNWVIILHICTDIPYPSDVDDNGEDVFHIKCWIGMGGIAAFVDRHGDMRPRSEFELGGERGCVTAIAAVAYLQGVPQCRSRYFLIIRKGIRYPDDVWVSARTGRPICRNEGDISGQRFVFQSREAKGSSTDIFVADYNGQRMCNITAQDTSAWDGFVDENGNEVVRWTEDGQIQFYSTINGKGFGELITRPDCVPSPGMK